ncbi:hypothetical protein N7G274_002479 [Stereocaulon virgatum]|uniref:Uncharacterized protein n=1 Tax=Stereocaulon virgatum TaxID=373712 RepID=A0ABR4AG25_9LECA
MVAAGFLEDIAHAFLKALGTLDLDKIFRLHPLDCEQPIYPKSMADPRMDKGKVSKTPFSTLDTYLCSKFHGF